MLLPLAVLLPPRCSVRVHAWSNDRSRARCNVLWWCGSDRCSQKFAVLQSQLDLEVESS
jgi:hypothetical protein